MNFKGNSQLASDLPLNELATLDVSPRGMYISVYIASDQSLPTTERVCRAVPD